MKSQSIPLREANQNFSRIIAAVEKGQAFSITRRGREVARLLPTSLDAAAPGNSHDGALPVAQVMADSPNGESTLAERVLRLEARLDKLAEAFSVTGKTGKK